MKTRLSVKRFPDPRLVWGQDSLEIPRSVSRFKGRGFFRFWIAACLVLVGCVPSEAPFSSGELPIPPLLEGEKKGDTRLFSLELQVGTKSFLPGKETPTWGVNGPFLGPTIRASKGEKVEIHVKNSLPEETTIHWHGLHIPAVMDGGPHQTIPVGSVWKPSFVIQQRASLNWYHPHPHGKTGEHVYKGIAGFFLIEDQVSQTLDLPKAYGVDDIPIVLQDKNFDAEGRFKYISGHMEQMVGVKGRHLLVNGAIFPVFQASASLLRLRLLNGSSGRFYNLGFEGGQEFRLIATEGGLVETPVALKRLLLAPGERAEIVIDLRQEAGKRWLLKSFSSETLALLDRDDPKGGMHADALDSTDFPVMTFEVSTSKGRSFDLPSRLTTLSPPSDKKVDETRRFVLDIKGPMGSKQDFTINDASMDMGRIDFSVKRGSTEIWEIKNISDMPHPFHIHGISFWILDRQGKPVAPYERGWKDTVFVHVEETVRLIATFDLPSDPKIPYMYHCHILEHEDAGMMGQFTVID